MDGSSWHAMRSYYRDSTVTRQRIKPGTVRRIAGYARPYRLELTVFLVMAALDRGGRRWPCPLLLKTSWTASWPATPR